MTRSAQKSDKFEIARRWWTVTAVQIFVGIVGVSVIYFVSGREPEAKRIQAARLDTKLEQTIRAPSVSFILSAKEELDLSDDQIRELTRLATEETREMKPVDEALEKAENDFSAFMSTRGRRRSSVEEIMSEGRSMSEIGRRKRLIRQRHSNQALSVLNGVQRQRVLQLAQDPRSGGNHLMRGERI